MHGKEKGNKINEDVKKHSVHWLILNDNDGYDYDDFDDCENNNKKKWNKILFSNNKNDYLPCFYFLMLHSHKNHLHEYIVSIIVLNRNKRGVIAWKMWIFIHIIDNDNDLWMILCFYNFSSPSIQ